MESGNNMDKEIKSDVGGQRKSLGIWGELWCKIWGMVGLEEHYLRGHYKKKRNKDKKRIVEIENMAINDASIDGAGDSYPAFNKRIRELVYNPENIDEARRVTENFRKEAESFRKEGDRLVSSIPGNEVNFIKQLQKSAVAEFKNAEQKHYEEIRHLKRNLQVCMKTLNCPSSKLDEPKKGPFVQILEFLGISSGVVMAVVFALFLAGEAAWSFFHFKQAKYFSGTNAIFFAFSLQILPIVAACTGKYFPKLYYSHGNWNRRAAWGLLVVVIATLLAVSIWAKGVRETANNFPVQPTISLSDNLNFFDKELENQGSYDVDPSQDIVHSEQADNFMDGVMADLWFGVFLFFQLCALLISWRRVDIYEEARECRQKLDDAKSNFQRDSLISLNKEKDRFEKMANFANTSPDTIRYLRSIYDDVDKKVLHDANKNVQIYHRAYGEHNKCCPELPEITLENAEEYSVGISDVDRKHFNETMGYLNQEFLPNIKEHAGVLKDILDKIIELLGEFQSTILIRIHACEEEVSR